MNFLDFEQPIAELEAKIEELRHVGNDKDININEEIGRLKKPSDDLTRSILSAMTPWQVSQIARHPQRPYTLDYVEHMFTDFEELHGERNVADDSAIITGLARLEGTPVAIIGQQKGRDTRERIKRNYGMPKPEGYRKAMRIMQLAERFGLPILTFRRGRIRWCTGYWCCRQIIYASVQYLFRYFTGRVCIHSMEECRARTGCC